MHIDLLITILTQTLETVKQYKADNPNETCGCCPEPVPCPECPPAPDCPECPDCPDCPEVPTEPEPPIVVPPEPSTGKSVVGSNLHAATDWSPEYAFLDAFKMARPWMSGRVGGAWEDDRAVAVDADGWPKSLLEAQVLHTFVFWSNVKPSYKSGNYIVTWEGDADLSFYNQPVASRTANRAVLNCNPNNGGIAIDVTRINPTNYLRNIKIIHEDDVNATGVFNPAFLDSLKDYSFIRFMDWMKTNDSAQYTWDFRPKPSNAFYTTEKGMPLEIMCQLANRLGVDAWFNMGHRQSNDYVQKAAELVKQNINTDLKVYIEHSNEVWNSQFQVHQYALAAANANPTRYKPNGASDFEGVMNYHSARTVEISKIWHSVFGDRVVRVAGAWAANDWSTGVILNFENAHQFIDAVAIAPYFAGYMGDSSETTRILAMTDAQIFTEIQTKAIPQAINWMKSNKAVADVHGKKLICYEAGQHLVGNGAAQNNSALTQKFVALNKDVRMGQMYKLYLDQWKSIGGKEFANFSSCSEYSQYGSWGLVTDLISPKANFPKYVALIEWIAANKE